MKDENLVEVLLIGVPVETWKRATAHQEGLHREFEILASREPSQQLPRALIELIEDLRARFNRQRDQSRAPLLAAAERGDPFTDVAIELPKEAATSIRELGDMLDAADEFCRQGDRLLTQVTPPDLVRFRQWFLGEILSQLEAGTEPRPWQSVAGTAGHSTEAADEGMPSSDGAGDVGDKRIEFKEDLDLSSAGILHDQIITARNGHRGSGDLVVDLSGVGFMDSVGLSLLVSAYRRVTEEGTRVRLILPTRLQRLFEISGLIDMLQPQFVSDEEGRGTDDA